MKSAKRIICLLLAMMMLVAGFTALTGCGKTTVIDNENTISAFCGSFGFDFKGIRFFFGKLIYSVGKVNRQS